MKTCVKCGDTEPQVTFSAQRRQCNSCRKAYLRGYYATKGAYFASYRKEHSGHLNAQTAVCNRRRKYERCAELQRIKSNPCMDCGITYPAYVMDFDHRDASQKVGSISALVRSSLAWYKVLEEIAKCDLVCANCHRIRTYTRPSLKASKKRILTAAELQRTRGKFT